MSGDADRDLGPEELYYRLKPAYRALYRAARAAARERTDPPEPDAAQAAESTDPVHAQIRQQVADLLADSGLSPAERSRILDSIACPCCGGSGASFSLSIRKVGEGGF